jgi:hypothetical protein
VYCVSVSILLSVCWQCQSGVRKNVSCARSEAIDRKRAARSFPFARLQRVVLGRRSCPGHNVRHARSENIYGNVAARRVRARAGQRSGLGCSNCSLTNAWSNAAWIHLGLGPQPETYANSKLPAPAGTRRKVASALLSVNFETAPCASLRQACCQQLISADSHRGACMGSGQLSCWGSAAWARRLKMGMGPWGLLYGVVGSWAVQGPHHGPQHGPMDSEGARGQRGGPTM